jgi:hypothetical protein
MQRLFWKQQIFFLESHLLKVKKMSFKKVPFHFDLECFKTYGQITEDRILYFKYQF